MAGILVNRVVVGARQWKSDGPRRSEGLGIFDPDLILERIAIGKTEPFNEVQLLTGRVAVAVPRI